MSHAGQGLVTAALLSSTEELRAAGMEHEGERRPHPSPPSAASAASTASTHLLLHRCFAAGELATTTSGGGRLMLPSYHLQPGELDSCHPAVLSLVCSPADGAYAYATLDGGAHVVRRRAALVPHAGLLEHRASCPQLFPGRPAPHPSEPRPGQGGQDLSDDISEDISEAQIGSASSRANVLHLPR